MVEESFREIAKTLIEICSETNSKRFSACYELSGYRDWKVEIVVERKNLMSN